MRAVSLFSGVGGFEQGFERAGITTILQAEKDEWARSVLRYRYPHARLVHDVRDIGAFAPDEECPDGCDEPWCERHNDHYFECACIGPMQLEEEGLLEPDILYGGFPCTDISAAKDRWGADGVRGGESGLWSEFARVVYATAPRWVVVENTGRLRNGRDGSDLRAVVGELDALGYLGLGALLDAAAFGLPARRPRVFLVARRAGDARSLSDIERLADGFLRHDPGCVVLEGAGQPLAADLRRARPDPRSYRSLTPVEAERMLGWPDDWTRWGEDTLVSPDNPDSYVEISATRRLRMCGNGVAAPVAHWLAERIQEAVA